MTPHELLKAGLDHLERYGWVPFAAMSRGEPTCALGGLWASAEDSDDVFCEARDALWSAVGVRRMAGTGWNDAQTSFAPVKGAYVAAIEATAPDPAPAFPAESNGNPKPTFDLRSSECVDEGREAVIG